MSNHLRKSVYLVVMLIVGAVSLGANGLSYTITDFGLAGSGYAFTDINNRGDIVINGRVRLADGTMTTTTAPGWGSMQVRAVNDLGQVTGDGAYSAGPNSGFFYDGTDAHYLGDLGGPPSNITQPYGINSHGHVVGLTTLYRRTLPNLDVAFYYDGTQMIDLGSTVLGDLSLAYDINDSGLIVGRHVPTGGSGFEAFTYDGTTVTNLGTLGAASSVAVAVNEHGWVAGYLMDGGVLDRMGFYYDGVDMHTLGSLGGGRSFSFDINDLGFVVGESENADGDRHGFLYDSTLDEMFDLNDYIDPNSGWELGFASGINNAGQIIGFGRLNGVGAYYLLTPDALAPIPEPATWTLLGLGIAGLAVRRKRRAG